MDNFVEAIQVEKDFETTSSCLGKEEDLMESNMERIISKLKDEIKRKREEGRNLPRRKLVLAIALKFLRL